MSNVANVNLNALKREIWRGINKQFMGLCLSLKLTQKPQVLSPNLPKNKWYPSSKTSQWQPRLHWWQAGSTARNRPMYVKTLQWIHILKFQSIKGPTHFYNEYIGCSYNTMFLISGFHFDILLWLPKPWARDNGARTCRRGTRFGICQQRWEPNPHQGPSQHDNEEWKKGQEAWLRGHPREGHHGGLSGRWFQGGNSIAGRICHSIFCSAFWSFS